MNTNSKGPGHPIAGFRGEYAFLSNFHHAVIWMSANEYPSVEHAYQAAKTLDSEERLIIRTAPTPAEAKRLGRTMTIQPAWEGMRLSTMRSLLLKKFGPQNPLLTDKLLATRDRKLIEVNNWGDIFWGVCRGRGLNWLGRLLMNVRIQRACEVK